MCFLIWGIIAFILLTNIKRNYKYIGYGISALLMMVLFKFIVAVASLIIGFIYSLILYLIIAFLINRYYESKSKKN